MKKIRTGFEYEVYEHIAELSEMDAWLLRKAMDVSHQAYAPYSGFRVGAAARMSNQEIITGTNQENASFPAGLCAERVVLAAAAARYPDVPIESIAVSYESDQLKSDHPISPCGICRQSLQEFENRVKHPVRLILGGKKGEIFVIPAANMLLPLAFTSTELRSGA
jgi:cytidine deaminase